MGQIGRVSKTLIIDTSEQNLTTTTYTSLMSHLIEEGGRFRRAYTSLIASHPAILYSRRALDENETRKKKLPVRRNIPVVPVA